MTAQTQRDYYIASFDCDGVITDKGAVTIGEDNHQKWDVTPILELLEMGVAVAVSTCNDPEWVAMMLRANGVPFVYVDPDITDQKYKVPLNNGAVMVTRRKVLADVYLDDHACQVNYGEDIVGKALKAMTTTPRPSKGSWLHRITNAM